MNGQFVPLEVCFCVSNVSVVTLYRVLYRIFSWGGGGGGGGGVGMCTCSCSYSIGMRKHALSRGSTGMLLHENFKVYNL